MATRLATLAVALCAALAAFPPPAAHAYVLMGRPWPDTVITYRAGAPAGRAAAAFAARTWNRSGVGVRFRPTTGSADVVVRTRGGRCTGLSTVGRTWRAWVDVGPCGAGLSALVATHEFGHVMGLGHESRICALMNPHFDRSGTPDRCRRRTLAHWLAHPLHADDRRGARILLSWEG